MEWPRKVCGNPAGGHASDAAFDGRNHTIYGDRDRPDFYQAIARAIAADLTIAPLLVAAILGVFGRPLRQWLARSSEKMPRCKRVGVLFHGVAILLAMIAVTIIYRWARPKEQTLGSVIPGALIATLLWWVADLGLIYVRKMPYGMIYGGLAAVIDC